MKKTVFSHIPNLITSLNLLLGCVSIVVAFQHNLLLASILIFAAGFFDFLDGLAARLLHAYSEIGKMLDSLADVISFGVAPSVIMYHLINNSIQNLLANHNLLALVLPYTAFIIAIFSALRLAKFNIDTRQTVSFIGVPTPANAFLISSLPFIIQQNTGIESLLTNPYILVGLTIILSFLLVAEIPMISLKLKNLKFSENRSRFILIIASALLLIFFKLAALPLIFLLYVILSIIDNPQKNTH